MTYEIEVYGRVRALRGSLWLPLYNSDLGRPYEFAERYDAQQFLDSLPKPEGFKVRIVTRE